MPMECGAEKSTLYGSFSTHHLPAEVMYAAATLPPWRKITAGPSPGWYRAKGEKLGSTFSATSANFRGVAGPDASAPTAAGSFAASSFPASSLNCHAPASVSSRVAPLNCWPSELPADAGSAGGGGTCCCKVDFGLTAVERREESPRRAAGALLPAAG